MICGVICLRGSTFVAFCWQFCCFILGVVGISGGIICNLLSDWIGGGGVMFSRLGVTALMGVAVGATVMGGVVTLEKMRPPLVTRQVAIVIGSFRIENFRIVFLMSEFEHHLCEHMVLLGPGCGGHVSVLLLLYLHFPLRIETASLNCAGETQLCLAVSLLVFLVRIYYNSSNGPWLNLCTIHLYLVVPNFV